MVRLTMEMIDFTDLERRNFASESLSSGQRNLTSINQSKSTLRILAVIDGCASRKFTRHWYVLSRVLLIILDHNWWDWHHGDSTSVSFSLKMDDECLLNTISKVSVMITKIRWMFTGWTSVLSSIGSNNLHSSSDSTPCLQAWPQMSEFHERHFWLDWDEMISDIVTKRNQFASRCL
jgi:hypothetical protein